MLESKTIRAPELALKKMSLKGYEDIKMYGEALDEIYRQVGGDGRIEYTTPNGNRIVLRGDADLASMRNTRLYFRGTGNTIQIDGLRAIRRLNLACFDGSTVEIGKPTYLREMSAVSSHGSMIRIGPGCMMSTDILLYATKVHSLFNVSDGRRRGGENIHIGEHVWIGQGAKVLSGARVGSGSVIGSYSVLAGKVPNNCAAAGNPCRVTSENIFWTRETIHDNFYDHCKASGLQIPDFVRETDHSSE